MNGTMNTALYQKDPKENVQPSFPNHCPHCTWVMEHDNDPGHKSKVKISGVTLWKKGLYNVIRRLLDDF